MPYVPAHTNEIGSYTRSKSVTSYTQTSNSITPIVSGPTNQTDAVSYKSLVVDGPFHNTFKGFRLPTTYGRGVHRIENDSGNYDFWGLNSAGQRVIRYTGTDAPSGFAGYPHDGPANALNGSTGVPSNLINRAEAEALNKIKAQKINLGVTLAEMKRTVSMVQSTLVTLLAVYRAVRRGNFATAYGLLTGGRTLDRTFQSPQQFWLAMQYGWFPLIDDIYGGVQLVNNGFRDKNALFNVSRTITQNLDTGAFFTTGRSDLVITGSAKSGVKVKFWGCVTGDVARLSSLGLTNPLEIAWELTPYSFVLDWLVPVGAWLSTLDATLGVAFVAGCRTELTEWDIVAEQGPAAGTNTRRLEGKLPRTRNRGVVMRRTTYGSWPWVIPYWKNPLTTTHTLSAIALLTNTRR